MNNNFNNISLLHLISKWKWHILIITVAAAICGAFFSSSIFITPKYKSEAVAYPANVSPYSTESETEQMLQIINSQSIMDSIVEKYNLWEHYGIDKNGEFAKTYMLGEYHDNIRVSKTPYDAVAITVLDSDPIMACNIAKDILNFHDQKIRTLHKRKAGEVVKMYEQQLRLKQEGIDSLKNRLSEISSTYGVLDYEQQTKEVTKGYLTGQSPKAKELKENMEKYGSESIELQTKIAAEATSYVTIKADYEQELRFYNADMTYSNIVNEPFPSDKKAYPVRWVIVALSAIGALLFSFVAIIIIENRQAFVANK